MRSRRNCAVGPDNNALTSGSGNGRLREPCSRIRCECPSSFSPLGVKLNLVPFSGTAEIVIRAIESKPTVQAVAATRRPRWTAPYERHPSRRSPYRGMLNGVFCRTLCGGRHPLRGKASRPGLAPRHAPRSHDCRCSQKLPIIATQRDRFPAGN
jgi:hypothetical protein